MKKLNVLFFVLISFSIFIGCERGTVKLDSIVVDPPKEDSVKTVIIKDTILVTPIGGVLGSNSSKNVLEIKIAGFKGWEFNSISVSVHSLNMQDIGRFVPVNGTSFLADDYSFEIEKSSTRAPYTNQILSFFQPKTRGMKFSADTTIFYIQLASGEFLENSYFKVGLGITLMKIIPDQNAEMKSFDYFKEENYPLFALQGSLKEDIAPFMVSKISKFKNTFEGVPIEDIAFSIVSLFANNVYLHGPDSFIFELDGTMYSTSEIQNVANVKILQPEVFNNEVEGGNSIFYYIRYTGEKDFDIRQILYSLSQDGEVKKITVD